MEYKEVKIQTTSCGLEVVTGVLLQLGITGFVVVDPKDFEEFLEGTQSHWDYVDDKLLEIRNQQPSITVYIPQNAQGREVYLLLKNRIEQLKSEREDLGNLLVSLGEVAEEDWANSWKQFFKPFYVGRTLYVTPTWESIPDGMDRRILKIDPGMSFGTGQHDTTLLCMQFLEDIVKQGDNMLDIGCGSGILSITSALLGAKYVAAVDIDENSAKIAKENLKVNHVFENRADIYCGDITSDESLAERIGLYKYDVVVANIVADVLIMMAPSFSKFMKKGARLLLSGIIDHRMEDVKSEFTANGFEILEKRLSKDWAAVLLRVGERQ